MNRNSHNHRTKIGFVKNFVKLNFSFDNNFVVRFLHEHLRLANTVYYFLTSKKGILLISIFVWYYQLEEKEYNYKTNSSAN